MSAAADILSQDELDALLAGVDRGEVGTDDAPVPGEGLRRFDFASQDRTVRGHLPALDLINDRFARQLRVSVAQLLRRRVEVSAGRVQMMKLGEYLHGLHAPASINLIKARPLRGTGLLVLEPKLVFCLVDGFFGGTGRPDPQIEGREFTSTELRVAGLLLDRVLADLARAWEPVYPLEPVHVASEANPHFANVVDPAEVVVVTTLALDLEGGGGGLHLVLPYPMIEPIRELLDTGVRGDSEARDERWARTLQAELGGAELTLSATLGEARILLSDLLRLDAGEVITFDMPALVTATVENVPLFRGHLGSSRGNLAVRVAEWVRPPSPAHPPAEEDVSR